MIEFLERVINMPTVQFLAGFVTGVLTMIGIWYFLIWRALRRV